MIADNLPATLAAFKQAEQLADVIISKVVCRLVKKIMLKQLLINAVN